MIYRLIILNGDRRNEHITITPSPMTIGRAATCDICLNDPEIAINHAEIVHTPDGLHIRDLGSMNRLLVNHKEVRDTGLKHGDVLEIGHTRALVQAYVQAEIQGDEDDDEKKERRKSWLIASGVVLLVIGLLVLIPRCERFITAPRVAENTVTAPPFPTHSAPPKVQQPAAQVTKAPQPSPPEPTVVPPTTPTVSRPEPDAPPPAPPSVAEPVKPVPVKPEPALIVLPPKRHADTSRHVTKPNPASDLILAAQKELQDATLVLNGNKPAAVTTNPAPAQPTTNSVPTDPVPTAPPPPPAVSVIKIINTDMVKFPETEKFHEMRLLTIHLATKDTEKEINPDAVRVEVVFTELNPTTGLITPALPGGTPADLTVQGKWPGTEQKSVVASYVVPVSPTTTNYLSQYHGFTIRVFYQDALQDELSQPKDPLRQ